MSSAAPQTIDRAYPVFAGLPLLQEAFSGPAVGVALFDDELRYVWVNPALAKMNALGAREHVGRCHHEVVPHLASAAVPVFQRVLNIGEPVVDCELSGETPAHPGETRDRLVNVCALRHAQRIVGLGPRLALGWVASSRASTAIAYSPSRRTKRPTSCCSPSSLRISV
jgi:PAS domain-containing protein